MEMFGYIAGGAAIGALSAGIGGMISQSGGFLANTNAAIFGSAINSYGMAALSGGAIDASVSFEVASFDVGKGSFKTFSLKNNSAMENIGYGIGAMGVAGDYIDFRASGKAVDRANLNFDSNMDPSQIPDLEPTGFMGFEGKWWGPGSDIDPRVLRLNPNNNPVNQLDEFAYLHDVGYYDKGADGFWGAIFSRRVVSDDVALVKGSRLIMKTFKTGGILFEKPITPYTYQYAVRTYLGFGALVGLKQTFGNSYLYYNSLQR